MELTIIKEKIPQYLKKYKYAAIILIIGLMLMWLPSKLEKKENNNTTQSIQESEMNDDEQNLKDILSKIKGAGRVEVLLTRAVDSETQYQSNGNYTSDESGENNTVTTVIVTDSSRNESGLVQRKIAPIYRGAVVVCDGAEDPAVRLALVEAVSKVTGLSTNHISVLKME